MDISSALALISATLILVAIPGPNVALFIANTIAYGARYGAATVVGTTLGMALQLALVTLGFALILQLAADAFIWLKWAGVLYLVYLGIKTWQQGIGEMDDPKVKKKSPFDLFWQGFILAIINPKTMIFCAAFLPQFIDPANQASSALMIPSLIYISVLFFGDMIWVAMAHSARPAIHRLGRLRHKLSGGLFFLSGLGLAITQTEK